MNDKYALELTKFGIRLIFDFKNHTYQDVGSYLQIGDANFKEASVLFDNNPIINDFKNFIGADSDCKNGLKSERASKIEFYRDNVRNHIKKFGDEEVNIIEL